MSRSWLVCSAETMSRSWLVCSAETMVSKVGIVFTRNLPYGCGGRGELKNGARLGSSNNSQQGERKANPLESQH